MKYRMLSRGEWRALTTVAQVDVAMESRAATLDESYKGWLHRSMVNYELKRLMRLRYRLVEQEVATIVGVDVAHKDVVSPPVETE